MIEYLRGKLAELHPTMAVIECMGVGYGVNITLNTSTAIQGEEEVKLLIHEAIRDDVFQLWGFYTWVEREVFLLLISVNGVGPNTARMILSALSPEELCNIISNGNAKQLTQIKGIGPKAAQRIIVELGDKIIATAAYAMDNTNRLTKNTATDSNSEVADEAIQALTMLGFSPAPTTKVVRSILANEPYIKVEDVIKKALKQL